MPKKIKHEITKICACCEKAEILNDSERVLCQKHGVVSADYKCRKFRYDPLKRNPSPPLKIEGLSPEDILL